MRVPPRRKRGFTRVLGGAPLRTMLQLVQQLEDEPQRVIDILKAAHGSLENNDLELAVTEAAAAVNKAADLVLERKSIESMNPTLLARELVVSELYAAVGMGTKPSERYEPLDRDRNTYDATLREYRQLAASVIVGRLRAVYNAKSSASAS